MNESRNAAPAPGASPSTTWSPGPSEKTRNGSPETTDLAQIFKALSDVTRLRILGLLCERELCVGEIEYLLGVSQTNVSRHLDRLRNAGLVTYRRQAQWIYYGIFTETLDRLPGLKGLIEKELARSSDCVADAAAFREYEDSGMGCEQLPNCRRNQPHP